MGAYLVLDLGNDCPLSCRHCIQSEQRRHAHFDRRGKMDPQRALSLLDELQQRGRRFHVLILFWLGEPLSHPQFQRIHARAVEAARAGVFHRIEVHTNAVLLTEEIGWAVTDTQGVEQRWHFSLDAVRPDTYRRIKGLDRYEHVEAAVRRFLADRQAAANGSLKVAFQFIPQRLNAGEATAFVRHWRRVMERHGGELAVVGRAIPEGEGDCVFFRQLDALDPAGQSAANALYEDVLRQVGINPPPALRDRVATVSGLVGRLRKPGPDEPAVVAACACPFLSPIVHWDGRVTVCTRDSALSLCVGDLNEARFHEIWWESETLAALRRAHLRGNAGGLCRDCPIPRSANYTGLEPEDRERYQMNAVRS